MHNATAHEIGNYLCGAAGISDGMEGRDEEALILHGLASIPQPDFWVWDPAGGEYGPDTDGMPTVLLLAGDSLIEAWVGRDDGGAIRLRWQSRPLVNAGAVIEMEWRDREAADGIVTYRTIWGFKFTDGRTVVVRGRVQSVPSEALDYHESFARGVAAALGERVAPSEAA
jgi:hypothetical protein